MTSCVLGSFDRLDSLCADEALEARVVSCRNKYREEPPVKSHDAAVDGRSAAASCRGPGTPGHPAAHHVADDLRRRSPSRAAARAGSNSPQCRRGSAASRRNDASGEPSSFSFSTASRRGLRARQAPGAAFSNTASSFLLSSTHIEPMRQRQYGSLLASS